MFDYYRSFFLILFGMAMAASGFREEYFRCADLETEIIPLVTVWAADFMHSNESDAEGFFYKQFNAWWKETEAEIEE